WLASTSSSPLAILGGYGTGKTTYAKMLASALAETAKNDWSARIPILLRLGDLTEHQNIRALISVLFAAEFGLDGFTYNKFSSLNNSGKFVLIFDGFDEMKHAMRRVDIRKNFESISSMVGAHSKVILFGRPDPFVTVQDEVLLHGHIAVLDEIVTTPS